MKTWLSAMLRRSACTPIFHYRARNFELKKWWVPNRNFSLPQWSGEACLCRDANLVGAVLGWLMPRWLTMQGDYRHHATVRNVFLFSPRATILIASMARFTSSHGTRPQRRMLHCVTSRVRPT
jgi:hypothetical protein